jgi:cobalamin biosynthesis protein CobD/CbiB
MEALEAFMGRVITFVINPIIGLFFALALYFFVIGVATYILKSDDPKERAKGTQHLLWGVIGMFIMVSVTAILATLTNSICGTPFCGGLGEHLPQ